MYRVFVVEDEELISTMLRINLSRSGYEASCFVEAESMLEKVEQEPCDILLLDVMLPGMSGDEALKQLRARGHTFPVIMLTARRDLALKVGTLDGGADDYVTKPFDMTELLARIRALLRRERADGEE